MIQINFFLSRSDHMSVPECEKKTSAPTAFDTVHGPEIVAFLYVIKLLSRK